MQLAMHNFSKQSRLKNDTTKEVHGEAMQISQAKLLFHAST